MSDPVIQSLWDDHVGWSRTAERLKRRFTFWRAVTLILIVLGAALQTLAAKAGMPEKLGVGIGGTVALALVPFLTRYFLSSEEMRKWLRARSVSEGIKSEIYAYRAGAEPYDSFDALNKLRTRVKEIRSWAKTLELERARIEPQSRPVPPALNADDYLRLRVRHQIDQYYRPKARESATWAERYRWAEIILAGLAAVLSAIATAVGGWISEGLGPWVAVLTTIGGAVAAHAASSRYDSQAATFFATAAQLEDLIHSQETAPMPVPSKEWSAFVRACEEAISAENRDWMAKLDKNSHAAS